MNTRKRIAVFVGQADESYQSRFIAGFLEGAFAYDMDVCVFAMYRKYQDTTERELGDSNIFSLMEPSMFDGVVILEDTIQTAGAADALEERLHESFRGPVLVVETQSRFFDSIFTDGYTPVTELVEHLIVEHGFKDIAFLTGKKWHKHSQERLKAYRDTMAKHGLPVSEDRVFYGDFWYQSGENCADQILMKRNNLPEAIVCANDGMAIGLCKALTEFGIRIPEDIAVLSYDSTFDGQTSPKSITSSLIPAAEFGKYSAGYINNALHGRTTPPFKAESGLLIGETCGCKNITMPHFDMKRREWDTELSLEGFDSINNMMLEELMAQTELTEYLGSVYSYAYQIKGAESFHLCLCSQWKYMGQSTEIAPKNSGYPENMIYAVKYNRDRKDGLVGLDRAFPVKDILPALTDERDHPAAFFFTPVFFKDLCFGYACVSYGNTPRSYDDVYRRWIGSVSHGFEFLRRSLVIAGMQDRLDKIKKRKFEAAAAYENLSDDEKTEYSMVEKILDENLLSYHFQPIVDTVDGSIYSFEALMRPQAERFISPLAVIKYAGMQGRLIDVEKATFLNVLRIIDSDESIPGSSKVFINSIPGVILSESDLEKVKAYLGKYSDRIVVELTEEAELSDAELDTLKSLLRSMNVEIAVDDYGTGYSNVNNLLRYMPDYVKIDRALLSDIQNKPQKQHFVRELINFCRDNNIKALAEGVETAEELRTVIHLGADLIQGYYTARPAPGFISGIDDRIRSEIRTYRQEYLDGTRKEFYVAGKTNRVMLASLVKEGCTDIIVGQGTMVYRDITFVGT
ncbi:MAG: EAL domain-containing protein, partial [Ruminiclostridium sp.]|nr:EAL domain-containing protein [Ruminiclostridium sp.]